MIGKTFFEVRMYRDGCGLGEGVECDEQLPRPFKLVKTCLAFDKNVQLVG